MSCARSSRKSSSNLESSTYVVPCLCARNECQVSVPKSTLHGHDIYIHDSCFAVPCYVGPDDDSKPRVRL